MAQSFESLKIIKSWAEWFVWGVKIGKRLLSGRLRNNSKMKDVGRWVSLMSLFPTHVQGVTTVEGENPDPNTWYFIMLYIWHGMIWYNTIQYNKTCNRMSYYIPSDTESYKKAVVFFFKSRGASQQKQRVRKVWHAALRTPLKYIQHGFFYIIEVILHDWFLMPSYIKTIISPWFLGGSD